LTGKSSISGVAFFQARRTLSSDLWNSIACKQLGQDISHMHLDVLDLRAFYMSPLGSVARRVIARHIRSKWRKLSGQTLIGIGYATPYIGSYRGEVLRLGAFMPAGQGAIVWPSGANVNTVMIEEDSFPLPDNSVDKILLIHGLEVSERARPLMREIWRILAPEGRVMIVVPNRMGVWSRRDATPFGHGHPYSRAQLQKLLHDSMFTPLDWTSALHAIPVNRPMAARWAHVFERMGSRFWPRFAGVLIVEARKELQAPVATVASARRIGKFATADGIVARTSPQPVSKNSVSKNKYG
jgi:SAM-dependent methyltransferase